MPSLVIVPYPADTPEAARLIDADATPLASVLEPTANVAPGAFRGAAVGAALERGAGPAVAGILFTAQWGGGGVLIT